MTDDLPERVFLKHKRVDETFDKLWTVSKETPAHIRTQNRETEA